MATSNDIGKTLYVSAALPATNDDAGFEALTWTKVNGLQELPQLGVSHANIDVSDLQSGFTAGVKGAATGNDSTMMFRDIGSDDAGQGIVQTASDGAAGTLSVKIVKGSGTDNAPTAGDPVEYAQGYAHSYIKNKGTTTSHEGFSANFKQNDLSVEATEPV